MTFIESLLNNDSDIDEQFNIENNNTRYWKTLEFIKSFNVRQCRCCNCELYELSFEKYEEYQQNCGNIGNQYICYEQYVDRSDDGIEEEYDYCQCKCIYPTINGLIINDDDKYQILSYLQEKIGLFDDYLLDYESNLGNDIEINSIDLTTLVNEKLKNTSWNHMVIEIFNINYDDVKIRQKKHSSKLHIYAMNYNVLRIMSGFENLHYNS